MSSFEKLQRYLEIEMIRRDNILKRSDRCLAPPHQFYVEPTNICNNRCIMCVPKEKKGKPGYLPPERWKTIIDSMAKYNLDFPITMIGRGEPLLHKDISDFVEYATSKDIPCYIITNGRLLTDDLIRQLLNVGIKKIQVSLHAHSADVYKTITRRNAYEEVKSNLLNLIELNKELGKPCYVSVMAVESSINTHEIRDFQEYWTPRVDRCFVTQVYSAQGDSGLTAEATSRPDLIPEHPGCVIPWYYMGFRYDGNISPCPFDFEEDFIIGNVDAPNFDLMDTWNGEIYRKFRKCHIAREFSFTDSVKYPCRTCEVPRTVDNCKGLDEWVEKFHKVFARQYAPLIR